MFPCCEIGIFQGFEVYICLPPVPEGIDYVVGSVAGAEPAFSVDIGVVDGAAGGEPVCDLIGAAEIQQVFGNAAIGQDTFVIRSGVGQLKSTAISPTVYVNTCIIVNGMFEESDGTILCGHPGSRFAIGGGAFIKSVPLVDQQVGIESGAIRGVFRSGNHQGRGGASEYRSIQKIAVRGPVGIHRSVVCPVFVLVFGPGALVDGSYGDSGVGGDPDAPAAGFGRNEDHSIAGARSV